MGQGIDHKQDESAKPQGGCTTFQFGILGVLILVAWFLLSFIASNTGTSPRIPVPTSVSEIKSADLALTKMLSDAEETSFIHFFINVHGGIPAFDSLREAEEFYTNAFYWLLRRGRDAEGYWPAEGTQENADIVLNESILAKLGDSYMDLDTDPWGNLYRFFAGPLKATGNVLRRTDDTYVTYPMPYRIYRPNLEVPSSPAPDVYTLTNVIGYDGEPLEQPIGYPAQDNFPVYIYSPGPDGASAQALFNTLSQ